MEKTSDINYSCPKWEDFPDIELYMDQVISVLEKYLNISDDEKTVTSTMINNYVKQKIIAPPQNKKYSRDQLAYIFMVCVLKKFMQLNDINILLNKLEQNRTPKETFEIFSSEMDYCLDYTFHDMKTEKKASKEPIINILRSALMTVSGIMKTKFLIGNETDWTDSNEKSKK